MTITPLYLHDDGVEKLAKEAQTSFEKVDTEEMFKKAAENLQTNLDKEQTVALRRLTARHEYEMAQLINGMNEKSPAEQLIAQIDSRLDYLLGTVATKKLIAHKKFDEEQENIIDNQEELEGIRRRVSKNWKLYKDDFKGKNKNSCLKPIKNPVPKTPHADDDQDAIDMYGIFLGTCDELKDQESLLKKFQKKSIYFQVDSKKEWKTVDQKKQDLKQKLSDIKSAKKLLKSGLDELEVEFKGFQKVEKEEKKRKENFKKYADKIAGVLDALEKGSDAIDKINKFTDGKIDLSSVKGVIDKEEGWVGKLLRAEILETDLEAILTQMGELGEEAKAEEPKAGQAKAEEPKAEEPKTAEEKTEKEEIALQYWLLALKANNTLPKLKDVVFNLSNLPSRNSVLIGLTYQRYQIKTNSSKLDLLADRLKITEIRQRALEREILELWKARNFAEKVKSPPHCSLVNVKSFAALFKACEKFPDIKREAAAALVAYDQAWAMGNAVDYRANLMEGGMIRKAALAQTKENTKVWIDVLKPAVDELVAYGENGIKSETIANLIQASGLAAIAGGVN